MARSASRWSGGSRTTPPPSSPPWWWILHHPFPHLPSKSLNIAVELRREGETSFGVVPIPRSLPPFLRLSERGLRYILTEQIVLEHVGEIFDQYQVVSGAVIAVTRNADISPEDEDYDVGEDFREHMIKVLKKRNRLAMCGWRYRRTLG